MKVQYDTTGRCANGLAVYSLRKDSKHSNGGRHREHVRNGKTYDREFRDVPHRESVLVDRCYANRNVISQTGIREGVVYWREALPEDST